MKKLVLALLVSMPATVFAQGAFDGTWKVDLGTTQFAGKQKFSLDKGVYRCETCVPKVEVKADGKDHKVRSPYHDTLNVREVDDHNVVIVGKKNGKVMSTNKLSASQDGKMLDVDYTGMSQSGQPISSKYSCDRVGDPTPGANGISGEWQPGKLENASESVTTVTFKSSSDGLSMTDKAGDSYDAKFDGKDYPYKGDPGITSVSLKKVDDNTIEETDKRNGKVVAITRMAVGSDGQTLDANIDDKLAGITIKWTAKKQ